MGEYSTALAKGDELPAAERKAVIDKLVRYSRSGRPLSR